MACSQPSFIFQFHAFSGANVVVVEQTTLLV
jgi:hypothetical protein